MRKVDIQRQRRENRKKEKRYTQRNGLDENVVLTKRRVADCWHRRFHLSHDQRPNQFVTHLVTQRERGREREREGERGREREREGESQ